MQSKSENMQNLDNYFYHRIVIVNHIYLKNGAIKY